MIRKAEEKDVDQILNLLKQISDIHYKARPDIFKNRPKYTKDEILFLINSEYTPVFVYTDGDKVLGHIFLIIVEDSNPRLKERRYIFVDDLCVDNDYRNKGIGKSLMEYAETFAKSLKIDTIELNVWHFKENAFEFYKELGYSAQCSILEKKL